MTNQDEHLKRLVQIVVDQAALSDPEARHPCVPVHRVTNEVMHLALMQPDDRSSVMSEICAAALRRGFVVEFERTESNLEA